MSSAPSGKCEHGYCGDVRDLRELKKRWNAQLAVSVGSHVMLVCESCRHVVVTNFRREGHDPVVTPLRSP